jgi:hypothetical protein
MNTDVEQKKYLEKVYKVTEDDDGKYTAQKANLTDSGDVDFNAVGGAYKKKRAKKTLKKKTKSNKKKRGLSRRK